MRTILTLTQLARVVVYEADRHHDGKQHYGVAAAWPENSLTLTAVLTSQFDAIKLARRWASTPGATVRALGEAVPEASDPAGNNPSAPAEIGSDALNIGSGMPVLDATR